MRIIVAFVTLFRMVFISLTWSNKMTGALVDKNILVREPKKEKKMLTWSFPCFLCKFVPSVVETALSFWGSILFFLSKLASFRIRLSWNWKFVRFLHIETVFSQTQVLVDLFTSVLSRKGFGVVGFGFLNFVTGSTVPEDLSFAWAICVNYVQPSETGMEYGKNLGHSSWTTKKKIETLWWTFPWASWKPRNFPFIFFWLWLWSWAL